MFIMYLSRLLELRRRFEAPNPKNRWDSPLYRVNMTCSSPCRPATMITTMTATEASSSSSSSSSAAAAAAAVPSSSVDTTATSAAAGGSSTIFTQLESTATTAADTATAAAIAPASSSFKSSFRRAKGSGGEDPLHGDNSDLRSVVTTTTQFTAATFTGKSPRQPHKPVDICYLCW